MVKLYLESSYRFRPRAAKSIAKQAIGGVLETLLTILPVVCLSGCFGSDALNSADLGTSTAENTSTAEKRSLGGPAKAPSGSASPRMPLAPLASRRTPGPLFQRIPATQSGLDFVHRWDPQDRLQRDQIATAFAGGAVALGDIDRDGLPEVFLTRPHHGARLYQNLGNFQFQDVTEKVGIQSALANHWASGATFVDIQGDGHLDLYVCGYRSANKLFINTGEGRFVERAKQYGLDFRGASIMMSFADYDRDGDLDAHLLTNRLSGEHRPDGLEFRIVDGEVITPEPYRDEVGVILRKDGSLYPYDAGQADRLYRNDSPSSTADRVFTDVTESAGLSGHWQGLSATWWDYNSDGWIDLYVANDFFGPDHLYRNNRDGTFSDVIEHTVPTTPWFSMGSDAGDLDGDGRLDFIASDMAAATHYQQKVNMGDMDSEGWFLEHGLPRQSMRNAVYINTGTPRFLEVAQMTGLAATDWTWAVKIFDFDSDGDNDVFFSNGMTRDFFHADLRAKLREIRWTTGENRWSDFPPLKQQNRLFENRGQLAFRDVSQEWTRGQKTVSFGAACGDLDGDGDLDLLVNNFEDSVDLYRNTGANGNRIKFELRGSGLNTNAIGAEVSIITGSREQVRVVQPVRGFLGCDAMDVVFGLGEKEFVDRFIVRWPSGKMQVGSRLAAGYRYSITESADAKPIAATSTSNVGSLSETLFSERQFRNRTTKTPQHIENDFDDFATQPLLPNKLSTLGPAMAWNDVDGNGRPDCFLGGAYGQPAQLWLQSSEGKLFRQRIPFFVDHKMREDVDAALFDADGDGDLDIYVVSGGVEGDPDSRDYQDRLYVSVENGLSVASSDALPDMNFSGGCVVAGDFDSDGDNDLFVGARVVPGRYPMSAPSRLLINETSKAVRFVDAPSAVAAPLGNAGMVTGAVWSDADGDDDLDILASTEYGPIKFYRNDGGHLIDATADAGLATRLGWWTCITAADVDHDGDTDYAIGNFGLNTKYHPTDERPQLLYYGDFGGVGEMHCVEAHRTGDAVVPNRGRSCSSHAMPFIADKFADYHSFAIAELADIYSTPKLQSALKREANELSTGILLNDGHGHFEFRPLPRLAQTAPSFGLAFLHADSDDNIDLYVSQNFYGPQRETGRMAGGVGLLLLGNGNGSFTELGPKQSGIIIPDDARCAHALDINGDGRDDLAVAVNNGPVKVLHNQRRDKRD